MSNDRSSDISCKINITIKSEDARKALEKIIDVITSPFRFISETNTVKAIDSFLADKIIAHDIRSIAASLGIEENKAAALALNAGKYQLLDNIKKQMNREAIAKKAVELIDGPVDSNKLDQSWVADFFDSCSNVSDEEMQYIWASMLKEEIKTHDTFSRRTIDVVKKMTKAEAEMFTEYCSKVFIYGKDYFRFRGKPMSGAWQDFPYRNKFVPIVEAGLIHHDIDRLFNISLPAQLNFYGIKVTFRGATSDIKDMSTYFTPLSYVGKELFKICGSVPDMTALRALKKHALHYDKVIVEW